ncbi:MAG: lysophospholipid acyltransferase family protein [Myxococcota bacterium]
MATIFSILFWLFFAASCVVFFAVAVILWILTWPFDRDRRLNHLFSSLWAATYAVIYPGWRVKVTGRQHIAPQKAYVLVANHTSIADVVLLFCLFRQFKWVSKTSVFRVPFLGWNMWLSRYVPLLRGDKESVKRMLEDCRRWLSRGMSILMFPEGTRSKDGVLLPFKPGAFSLASELGVPVIPIAIHGGHLLIPKHGKRFAARAELWVEVLEPIAAADPEALMEATRARLVSALGPSALRVQDPSPRLTDDGGAIATTL